MKVVLFDLDGTLLSFDKVNFTKKYINCLVNYIVPFGYESKKIVDTIFAGTNSMKSNIGNKTNEEIFWEIFESVYGKKALEDKKIFEEFYNNSFDNINDEDRKNLEVVNAVKTLKDKGYKLIVASNPVFPLVAQKKRIKWAGLNPDDFDFITSYETMHFSKPSLKYYQEILEIVKAESEDCIMVGNDVTEDMIAKELGMKVFLIDGFIENKKNEDISCFPKGNFKQLLSYIESNF